MSTGVEIVRLEDSADGIFGVLRMRGQVLCCTLEPPFLDNRQFVSSIPSGEYVCKRTKSRRFGETFEICGVPERTDILFHAGNTAQDTQGCVLLGRGLGRVNEQRGITDSRAACRDFMNRLRRVNAFSLHVAKAGPQA